MVGIWSGGWLGRVEEVELEKFREPLAPLGALPDLCLAIALITFPPSGLSGKGRKAESKLSRYVFRRTPFESRTLGRMVLFTTCWEWFGDICTGELMDLEKRLCPGGAGVFGGEFEAEDD